MQLNQGKRLFLIFAALSGSFALILQFYLMLTNSKNGIAFTITNYFSFFTILTNTLVTIFYFSMLLPKSKAHAFFSKPGHSTAVTLYILIVGLVYQLILRFTWSPEGIAMIVDELLHSVNPLLFLIAWIFIFKKNNLNWSLLLKWLIYPLAYLVYSLIRGSIVNWYPYPFIDVTKIGIQQSLVNSLMVTAMFVLIGSLLLAVEKRMSK